MENLYIGLMSGTSTDGVDAILANIDSDGRPNILGHSFIAMPHDLRHKILSLNQETTNELHNAAIVSNQLADLYAQTVSKILYQNKLSYKQIKAIGAHGQTIRHAPQHGYSIQLNNAALLAELTKIDVVCDFRSSDIAANGHGAPLVPAFHKNFFQKDNKNTVILNLGGIANITILHKDQKIIGFDTGPANVLLDAWIEKCRNLSVDIDGAWAKSGSLNKELLNYLIEEEPWFDLDPPKSTGRDLFNLKWLEQNMSSFCIENKYTMRKAEDIQATLVHLTAKTVIQAIHNNTTKPTQRIVVCGGGAFNPFLLKVLSTYANEYFNECEVISTRGLGIEPDQVESLAFAWLAWAYDNRIPANLPDATGAKGPRILGCKYLAS